jgi:L-ascorbate metabolism protein UlaG (beta-lactamase superfamily)
MVEAIEGYQSARVFQGLKDAKGSRSPDWNLINEKVGTVRVRNVPTYHDAEDGRLRGKNAVWIIEIDGLTICHLGDLGHPLTPAQIKAIGPVDVLFIPIGGVYTLNGSAAKQVVDQLKPKRYVFPMHYGVPGYDELLPADEFLDGQSHVQRLLNTNEFHIPLESTSDKPMTIVLLGWQKAQAVKP